jgi:putative FmdB family regulatory protein
MPIYEYYCASCDVRFNVLQKIDDPPPTCPLCKKANVRKLISSAAVVHSEQEHEAAFRQQQQSVDPNDKQDIARFFREQSTELSTRLEGQIAGSDAFAELLQRASDNTGDAGMKDLEDALVDATGSPYKMGEHAPEPEGARLAAQSNLTGKLAGAQEADRKELLDEHAGPGYEVRHKYGEDDDPEIERERHAKSAPNSPWSSDNIGWA